MKKRKSPIVLVTILAVMLSVSFGLQYAWSNSGGAGQEQPQVQQSDTQPVGEARPPESKESVAAGVKGALGGGGSEPKEAEMPSPMGSGPTILNAAATRGPIREEKPKPNPSSTSAQWYLNDKKG